MWSEKRCHCWSYFDGRSTWLTMLLRNVARINNKRHQYNLPLFFFPSLSATQKTIFWLVALFICFTGQWDLTQRQQEVRMFWFILFHDVKKKRIFTVFLLQVQNKVNWGNRETGDTASTFGFVVMLYILHKCFTVYLCWIPFDRKHGYLRRILIKTVDIWKKKRSLEDLVLVFATIFKYGNMSLSLVYRAWVLLFKNRKVKKINVSIKLLIPS